MLWEKYCWDMDFVPNDLLLLVGQHVGLINSCRNVLDPLVVLVRDFRIVYSSPLQVRVAFYLIYSCFCDHFDMSRHVCVLFMLYCVAHMCLLKVHCFSVLSYFWFIFSSKLCPDMCLGVPTCVAAVLVAPSLKKW